MRRGNGGIESDEGIEGVISERELGDFQPITFGSTAGDGQEGTADRGDKLFATISGDPGRSDTGDSTTEAPKKRRGRPPGSTNTKPKSGDGKSKLSDAELRAARSKLAESLAGGIGFGFSYYGVYRANKYKKISPLLANRVYGCYQIPLEAATSIGEPLADTFITWFPKYVEPVSKSIDPALAIGRLISTLQQTSENERLVVMQFQQEVTAPRDQPPSNGHHPPEPQDIPEDSFTQWNSEAPTPADILETPQTHIPTS